MYKILYLEDDKDYQSLITAVLENAGYEVECSQTVTDAYQKVKGKTFDLVISDLDLGGLNGFQLVELLHDLNPSNKILILTSSASPSDEIKGLDLGVSDYLNKSVSFVVLLKRIEWLLNKNTTNTKGIVELKSDKESLVLNLSERVVYVRTNPIKLSCYEFDILTYFLKNKNTAITRPDFIREVWSSDEECVDVRSVDTHIKNIRLKTGIRSILSIRSIGYKWVE